MLILKQICQGHSPMSPNFAKRDFAIFQKRHQVGASRHPTGRRPVAWKGPPVGEPKSRRCPAPFLASILLGCERRKGDIYRSSLVGIANQNSDHTFTGVHLLKNSGTGPER